MYVHLCMCVCICVHLCVCICVQSLCIPEYTCVYVYVYVHTPECTCVCVCACVCTSVCIHVCMCVHLCAHLGASLCVPVLGYPTPCFLAHTLHECVGVYTTCLCTCVHTPLALCMRVCRYLCVHVPVFVCLWSPACTCVCLGEVFPPWRRSSWRALVPGSPKTPPPQGCLCLARLPVVPGRGLDSPHGIQDLSRA